MTSGRLLGTVILSSLLGASSAFAGPITGNPPPATDVTSYVSDEQAADSREQNGQAAQNSPQGGYGDLFDPIGMPLLRTSGPLYLQLGERNKLRYVDSGAAGDVGTYSYVGNLNPELPISAGGGDVIPGITPIAQIPEPATLLLLAPAAALAIRRRQRARK